MADEDHELREEITRMLDLENEFVDRRLQGEEIDPKDKAAFYRLKAKVFRQIAAKSDNDALGWAEVAEEKARLWDLEGEC
jgi:hypothetical protein